MRITMASTKLMRVKVTGKKRSGRLGMSLRQQTVDKSKVIKSEHIRIGSPKEV